MSELHHIFIGNFEEDDLMGEDLQTKSLTENKIIISDIYIDLGKNIDKNLHELAVKIYEKYKDFKSKILYIPSILSDINAGAYTGARLAAHIRLLPDSKFEKFSSIPIVILGFEPAIDFVTRTNLSSVLRTPNTYYIAYNKLSIINFIKEKAHIFKGKAKEKIDRDEVARLEIKQLSNYQSHHSVDNELALIRWAKYTGAGQNNKLQKIIERNSTGLYFKYLLKLSPVYIKEDIKTYFIKSERPSKVLLIDDESEKGWKDFYEHFLKPNPNIKFKALEQDYSKPQKDDLLNDINNKIKDENPDVVLLDLRLHDSDFGEQKTQEMTGYKILEFIKKLNPGIQVIVITASNKVWHLKELQQAGADDFIVKRRDSDVREDIEHLIKSLEKGLKNSQLLKPYWKEIKVLEKENNILIKQISGDEKIKKRVVERLKMFFGLLKRGKEQNKFNEKMFYLSDIELAYITLWSVLNDIKHVYYQTKHPEINLDLDDKVGNKIINHPNGQPIIPIPGYNWKIKNQEEYLIKYNFEFEYDDNDNIQEKQKGFYKLVPKLKCVGMSYNKMVPPYYFLKGNNDNKGITKQLANQIAFLILAKNELKDHKNKNDFLKSLFNLNNKRNTLYLTHGDNKDEFYKKTIREKRNDKESSIAQKDIKSLFELVYFLLTGKTSNIIE